MIPGYSSLGDLQAWARDQMVRAPDFVIGDNYLRRWWIIPRNEHCNVYLHEINQSDDDRALHDHPWDNTSFLIDGEYDEVVPELQADESTFRRPTSRQISQRRSAGDVVRRKATDAHRLVIPEGGRAVSLFITGPKIREWGFWCPQGWRIWSEFVDMRDSGQVGRGCGE